MTNVGMSTYRRIKDIESKIEELGFKFKTTFYGNPVEYEKFIVVTKDDQLPIYRNGTEVFIGYLEEVESWVHGITWARDYDHLLGLKTGLRRERAEKRLKNKKLLETIKNSET